MNTEGTFSAHPQRYSTHLLPALLIPLAAFALQWFFWDFIQPYVWFLFYPALFFSAWICGMSGGVVATAMSTLIVWWFFIPFPLSFALERPASALSIVVFACMGVLFSFTQERLRKAQRQSSTAFSALNAARDQLEEKVAERTADLARAVDASRESELRHRTLFQNSMDAVLLTTPDGNILAANPAAQDMFGRSEEELCALGRASLVDPQDPHLAELVEERQRTGKAKGELTFFRKDGSRFHGEVSSLVFKEQSGELRTSMIIRDITERKRGEEEIRTLNQRLHHVIDAVKELSSAHTLESVQRIVATSARKLTGADGATMVFRDGDCCYYADEDAIEPLWKGKRFPLTACISGWVMLNKSPAVITDIYADDRIPKEAYRPTFVNSLLMIPVNADEPVAAIGNYWSGHHQPSEMEIELLQTLADASARAVENVALLEELEQRVAERTVRLQEANKELESFSYSVSHDLKAPLRGIDGYSRLLEEDYYDRLDEEGRLFLRNIRASAAQMHQLIEDLLDYSRIERRALRHVALDLPSLVQGVAAERGADFEAAGVLLRLEIPPLTVRADRDGLAMALRNLLENAVKFSREARPPTVEIGARAEDGRAVIWVRDNGIGFDMKFHDRIFDIFQRLQRVEDYPGTGIGLALVRKTMQRMGGRAWGESAPGKGATFFLEVPL